jgi:hypothetical protein
LVHGFALKEVTTKITKELGTGLIGSAWGDIRVQAVRLEAAAQSAVERHPSAVALQPQ